MTNSSRGIIQRSRWQLAGLALAAACFAMLIALPGSASASTVTCIGKTLQSDPATGPPIENPLGYRFTCSEKIIAYSFIANRSVDYFDPEVEVFVGKPQDGNVSNEAFGCEGPIPGNGFGCKGSATPDQGASLSSRYIDGNLGLSADPCAKHAKGAGFKSWIVVTTQQLDSKGTPFTISSEPFRLGGPSCKAAGGAPRH